MYLVRCADRSLYTGIAKDVSARIAAHNRGRGAAYTRSRRPVRLVYRREGLTRSAALIEEARIKTLQRTDKLAMVRKALGALALLWTLAPAARAVPVFDPQHVISVASATVQAFTRAPADGNTVVAAYAPTLRMYYLPAISSGVPHTSSGPAILSATSGDGVVWAAEAGTRLSTTTVPLVSASSITACDLLALNAGGFRMLYSIVSTTGAWRIHSATSADGLAWANESTVHFDGSTTTFIGVPRLVKLNSGDWRMYFIRDVNGGDDLPDRRIFTARSTDEGATWGGASITMSTLAYEVGAAKLSDGTVRLYYTQSTTNGSSATVIASALSSDALGTTFTQETGLRITTPTVAGALSFPVPVRSTDSFRWRLYYTVYDAFQSTGDARSAITGQPDPLALSPATVYTSAGSIPLSITGEIFSLTLPTVSISKGAVVIAGTGVARTDDQHLTASFATQGQAIGLWDLTVTNADGTAKTATNALFIDFAPGSVVLTGNLLRPRNGVPTTIDVTIFNAGNVVAQVYDSNGRAIRTLADGPQTAGSFTFTWDGKSATGSSVPSGVYFVRVTGPKLDTKSKIVLIR